jgi:hypothetical protein
LKVVPLLIFLLSPRPANGQITEAMSTPVPRRQKSLYAIALTKKDYRDKGKKERGMDEVRYW